MRYALVFSSLLLSLSAHANFQPLVPTQQDNADVQAELSRAEVASRTNYCIQGTLTCRQLVLYKDKTTKQMVPFFSDVFSSTERAVGSTGYFLVNSTGTFRALLDENFDGQVALTKKWGENQALTVTLDSNGYPTIHDLTLVRLGTSRYIVASLKYDANESRITGVEYDLADTMYQNPVSIVYSKQ